MLDRVTSSCACQVLLTAYKSGTVQSLSYSQATISRWSPSRSAQINNHYFFIYLFYYMSTKLHGTLLNGLENLKWYAVASWL